MERRKEIDRLFSEGEDFKNLEYHIFLKLIRNKYLREDVLNELLKDVDRQHIRKDELGNALEHCDKDLYKKFRDKELTLD